MRDVRGRCRGQLVAELGQADHVGRLEKSLARIDPVLRGEKLQGKMGIGHSLLSLGQATVVPGVANEAVRAFR